MAKIFFQILLTCDNVAQRPPISYRVCEYFNQFISEYFAKKNPKIINKNWTITLGIILQSEGRFGPKGIFLAPKPRTIKSDAVKLYEMVIPLKLIVDDDDQPRKAIEVIFEGVKIFFTSTYKTVTEEFMNELWKEVDLKYLLSLPYPASLAEQKYAGDYFNIGPDGTIDVVQV